jgi:hypothetical protein
VHGRLTANFHNSVVCAEANSSIFAISAVGAIGAAAAIQTIGAVITCLSVQTVVGSDSIFTESADFSSTTVHSSEPVATVATLGGCRSISANHSLNFYGCLIGGNCRMALISTPNQH